MSKIKWQCNFQIPDASVQLAEAFIEVVSFENNANECVVEFAIKDEMDTVVVKQWQQTFEKQFATAKDICNEVVNQYTNAVVL